MSSAGVLRPAGSPAILLAMRIFLTEFLTGGGLSPRERLPGLLGEGRAMLIAAARDLGQLPGSSLVTTLAPEVTFPEELLWTVNRIGNPADWLAAFDAGCLSCDATLVIAPETGGLLASLVRRVEGLGRAAWNCRPAAIDLCADKLNLSQLLQKNGVPTIPAASVRWDHPPTTEQFPVVVKPRDGAGSQLTRRIETRAEWRALAEEYRTAPELEPIVQPYVPGRALSVGAIFPLDARRAPILLPIAEQRLSEDGRFSYLGGELPADVSEDVVARIHAIVDQAAKVVPGLRGYVGFDLLLPDADPSTPLLVEINPRLTTSFVGYARLCPVPLASLWDNGDGRVPTWPARSIRFNAAGEILQDGE